MTENQETEEKPPVPVLDFLLDGEQIASILVRKRLKEAQRQYIMWAFTFPKAPVLELDLFPECPDIKGLRFYAKNYHLPVQD